MGLKSHVVSLLCSKASGGGGLRRGCLALYVISSRDRSGWAHLCVHACRSLRPASECVTQQPGLAPPHALVPIPVDPAPLQVTAATCKKAAKQYTYAGFNPKFS